ncbi:MAG: glycosyltransferase family 1 protein [Saprospiraceae bacterium]
MKIAINARFLFNSKLEGIGRYVYETSIRMIKNHPEHEFILLFDRPFEPVLLQSENVKNVLLPPPARLPWLWYLWFEVMIHQYLKKQNVDVFYSGDSYLSLKSKVPTLLVSHDLAYRHYPDHIPNSALRYYRKNFEKFHRRANHIIAVSNTTKEDIMYQYGIDSEKITVAYNAVDRSKFSPITLSERHEVRARYANGKPYFVYVGSLHPRKNIENLIKAYEWYRNTSGKDTKLVLVGRLAWHSDAIAAAMKNSEYTMDIIHLNSVGAEVAEIIAGAEAMVYVSVFEGFGIPILEGMSCGVPVICSNGSSMPEVAGTAALEVDPMEPVEIGEAMCRIVSNRQLSEHLVARGFQNLERFDWNQSAEIIWQKLVDISRP